MGQVRRQNIFNTTWAVIKYITFWLLVILQLPVIVFLPKEQGVRWMRVFMGVLKNVAGIKIKVHGKLSDHRPLLVVSNHISVFEICTFPIVFGGSFVAKKEMRSWPIVGWVAEKFGVIFVDRRPSHAAEALKVVQDEMKNVKYPMFVFPEGTSTNGAYVKEFKSTLFNFVPGSNCAVQPIAMFYRYRDGTPISDVDLANHYAYFDNAKMDMGPKCERERSAFMQIFHIMVIGGFQVDIHVLPVPDLRGQDRKEIAKELHEIVSKKYMELKDKKIEKTK